MGWPEVEELFLSDKSLCQSCLLAAMDIKLCVYTYDGSLDGHVQGITKGERQGKK